MQTLQILGLMVVRKMLDMVFSQHDLAWLDDLLPEKEKKKDDDKKKGKEKEKEKRKPKSDDSEEEVRTVRFCCPLVAPCVIVHVSDDDVYCACVSLQDKYQAYSNHSPSSESDLDRRYCVLKLHIPYKDLIYPDPSQSEWGARCQPATTHSAL